MAPFKQPSTLCRLSLSAVSKQLDLACTNIFLEHGCYGHKDTIHDMNILQNYLVSEVPTTLFEQLTYDRHNYYKNQPYWSKDVRIKLGILLHPSISTFSVQENKILRTAYNPEESIDEEFWCLSLSKLNNLVELNLNLIATDKILKVVSESCPKLETIRIVSRIEHGSGYTYEISLKFCVSDVGLKYLLKCQNLKKIQMDRPTKFKIGFTSNGVRALVLGLPKLEYIDCWSLWDILSHSSMADKVLNLRFFSAVDVLHIDIATIEKICPNLKQMIISMQNDMCINSCNSILNSLINSQLIIKHLTFRFFPFNEQLREFLRQKGHHLTEFGLLELEKFTSEELNFIGQHCPNLQDLHIEDVDCEENPYTFHYLPTPKIFHNLNYLCLAGLKWNPIGILPLMNSAKDLQKILLFLHESQPRYRLDDALLRLFSNNQFNQLEHLTIHSHEITMEPINKLIYECPKLKKLSFITNDSITDGDFDQLVNDIKIKNLQIELSKIS